MEHLLHSGHLYSWYLLELPHVKIIFLFCYFFVCSDVYFFLNPILFEKLNAGLFFGHPNMVCHISNSLGWSSGSVWSLGRGDSSDFFLSPSPIAQEFCFLFQNYLSTLSCHEFKHPIKIKLYLCSMFIWAWYLGEKLLRRDLC